MIGASNSWLLVLVRKTELLSTTIAFLIIVAGIEATLFAVGMVADILMGLLPHTKFTGVLDLIGEMAREAFFWVAIPLVIVALLAVINSVAFLVPILL